MKGWTILIGALLVGVALGVVGTLRLPSLAEPYLHSRLSAPTHVVEGRVTKKVREQDRVLARIEFDRAVVLASFTKKAAEVDLLLQEGDIVRLALPETRPFVEDPMIEAVQRPGPAAPPQSR
jgi:small basic protein